VNYIEKSWSWSHLLETTTEIERRIDLISSLSIRIESVPETRFIKLDNELKQVQKKVTPCHYPPQEWDRQKLIKLAISLDELSSAGLVHGDLCPRNICWDGVQYWIIDWEPSLWQIRKGRPTLIYTHPFIAPSEIGTTSSLTSLSDKVAFALTILKVSTKNEPSDDRIKEIENEVRCLSFKEIAEDF